MKRLRFDFCELQMTRLARGLRKVMGISKKTPDAKILRELYQAQPELRQTLDYLVNIENYFWISKGKKCLFPESSEFITDLLKSEFSFDDLNGFELPIKDSFMVPIPRGLEFDGIPIPPMIVNRYIYKHSPELVIGNFEHHLVLQNNELTIDTESAKDDEYCTVIIQSCPDGTSLRLLILDSVASKVLACKDANELRQLTKAQGVAGLTPNSDEGLQQLLGLKLALALGIYHSATEGKFLKTGLPSGMDAKVLSKVDKAAKTTAYYSLGNPHSSSKDINIHNRRGFFRQLKHDKWYTGKYEGHPRGSRWSYVSPTVVGESKEVLTQTDGGKIETL